MSDSVENMEESPNSMAIRSEGRDSPNEEIPSVLEHSQDNEHDNSPEYVVDINNPEREGPLSSKKWSIFRVPAHVREVDERAYNPKIVSIGPFHHKEPGLKTMETQKLRFLNRLVEQINHTVESLKTAMKEMEVRTRECYFESFEDINSNDFVHMMVLDGCFIVELLRLYDKSYKGQEVDEPIFATRWMLPCLGRDLLMLENQLPLFVLQELFKLTNLGEDGTSLNELALQFFKPLRPGKDKMPSEESEVKGQYEHLLALFQSSFVPNITVPSPSRLERWKWNNYDTLPGQGWVKNAKSLNYAGVRFRKKSGNLLDIEFKEGMLKIPTLFIDDGTSPVLRNLLAYEQSNRYAAPYFTCLAVFFDSIVDTPDDIKVLRDAGIIKQAQGGDEEVVKLFNSLTKELEFDMDDCYITKQIEDINRFCRSLMARLKVQYRHALSQIDFMKVALSYISLVQTVISLGTYKNEPQVVHSSAPSPLSS